MQTLVPGDASLEYFVKMHTADFHLLVMPRGQVVRQHKETLEITFAEANLAKKKKETFLPVKEETQQIYVF
jgi:hypothetical protein